LVGERWKKKKNIIAPSQVGSIQDFLSDSTQYASFVSPGVYKKDQPRTTQLSRFGSLEKVFIRKTIINNPNEDSAIELDLWFRKINDTVITRFVIGGIQEKQLPVLAQEQYDKGYQMPMGIANHTFYSDYKSSLSNPTKESTYYSFLLNERGEWLDSHEIGIDGPLLYWDKDDPAKLHFWILSFERHSFVGHFEIDAGHGE
jgi:hypothetical protein